MSDNDSMIVDITTRILRDLGDPQVINNASDDSWRAPLWQALEEAGLTSAWVPEELGGAGLSVPETFDVLRVAGSFALPVPLAETLIAGWLLARAGIKPPAGPMTVAPVGPRDRFDFDGGKLTGGARGVPFGRECGHVVVLAGGRVALLAGEGLAWQAGLNLANEPKDGLRLEAVAPLAEDEAEELEGNALMLLGAAVRAAQMAGALEAILEISVRYAGERVAFERPIAKFQAVQHNLAQLAGEAAAALAAQGSAAQAIERAGTIDQSVFLDVAAAKIRVGEAAGLGAAIAHQVHGAIGFTAEHVLHRYTHRLWSWRDEFGEESWWAVRLGQSVAGRGADALWPTLTAN